ncbi:MAG: hypothetical protein ACUVS3_01870 [Thermodesulfobacteriota bacterium]
MINRGELLWVLEKAYVPEHVAPLMESLSGGEAHLLEGYLVLVGQDWSMLVGYPLEPPGRGPQEVLELLTSRFPRDVTWFIGPKVPQQLDRDCLERETDAYFRIDLGEIGPGQWSPPGRLEAVVRKASQRFRVQRADPFGSAHRRLTDSFLATTRLSPRVKELYLRMPSYLETQEGGGLLVSAWSAEGRLAAYSVMELGAKDFSAHLLGCRCREKWAAYASDLLMAEMIRISLEMSKSYMNLGLGVTPGIRRFKEKWGAFPWLPYEMCAWRSHRSATERLVRWLLSLS